MQKLWDTIIAVGKAYSWASRKLRHRVVVLLARKSIIVLKLLESVINSNQWGIWLGCILFCINSRVCRHKVKNIINSHVYVLANDHDMTYTKLASTKKRDMYRTRHFPTVQVWPPKGYPEDERNLNRVSPFLPLQNPTPARGRSTEKSSSFFRRAFAETKAAMIYVKSHWNMLCWSAVARFCRFSHSLV